MKQIKSETRTTVHGVRRDSEQPTIHRAITYCGRWTCYGPCTGWVETTQPINCKSCLKFIEVEKRGCRNKQ